MATPQLDVPAAQVGRAPQEMPAPLVFAAFLMSGFAALIYQVVWQRALTSLYGVNIESITVVVSAFMLGLGIGSFLGGIVSKDNSRPLVTYFGLVELCIGLFGVVSLTVFEWVGRQTAGAGWLATFGLSFLMVVLPTALMGSTLPLLVAHLVKGTGNVGRSVGVLYFVNTLGSAFASIATAILVLKYLGLQKTTWLAAGFNIAVAVLVLAYTWSSSQRRSA